MTELYRCHHCGKGMETAQERCPDCGHLLSEDGRPSTKENGRSISNKVLIFLVITVFFLVSITIIYDQKPVMQNEYISFGEWVRLVLASPKKDKINPIDGAELAFVPEGAFLMGSNMFGPDEKPRHKVVLQAFWIYKNEVTVSQYMNYIKETKKGSQPYLKNWGRVSYDKNKWLYSTKPLGINIDYLSPLLSRRYPVVQINWYDAKAYCAWAQGDLPSEAEWEKAARGEDGYEFPWGNEVADASKANFCDKNCKKSFAAKDGEDKYTYLAPVGSFPEGASPYGALDMAGNVWEWTNDRYGERYYESSPLRSPKGPHTGIYRVIRGGAWSNGMADVRTTNRGRRIPSYGAYFIGFRCKIDP